MKVQRYTYGRTNVDELQAQRKAALSPKEAAVAAAVPYAAVSQASEAITNLLVTEDARDKRIQAREDTVNEKLALEEFKLKIDAIENDPANANQLQSDGTPTASTMLEKFQQAGTEYTDALGELQNPTNRENAQKLGSLRLQSGQAAMRKHVNDKREAWNAQSEFALQEFSLEARDYNTFNSQSQQMLDDGLISPSQYQTAMNVADAQKIDDNSDLILEKFEEAYQTDDGMAFYSQLINSDMDADLKKAAVKKVENQLANFEKVEKRGRSVLQAQMLSGVTDMLIAIKTNKPHGSVAEFTARGMLAAGNDPIMQKKILAWDKELRLAEISGVKSSGEFDEYSFKRMNDIYLDNTAANQKNLDREIQDGIVDGMSEDQMKQHAIDTQRDAGFLSASYEELFSTAARNDQYLAEIAPLWGELMMNPDITRSMDTKVEPENQTILTDTFKNIQSGMPALEAAQSAIKMREEWKTNKEVMAARATYYSTENRGVEESNDGFDDLIDDIYDATSFITLTATKGGTVTFAADPFGQGEFTFEGLGRDAQARYQQYFHNAFMQSNNLETAKMQADLQFTTLHNLNNLNGTWTVELNGIKGNTNSLRLNFINTNKDEVVVYSGDAGLTGSTIGDLDNVKFVNPVDTPNGKKYEVWTENVPVMQDVTKTVNGRTVVTREQVYKTIETAEQDSLQLERLRQNTAKEVARLESDYEAAIKAQESGSIYGREETADTLRNAPNKIKFAKENLRKAEARAK